MGTEWTQWKEIKAENYSYAVMAGKQSDAGISQLETKEMKNTVAAFDWLEETLGSEMFRELFPVILTDNGCEFADPELFEKRT